MPLMGLLVDWRLLRKEFLSLRISQSQPLNLESKGNRDWKTNRKNKGKKKKNPSTQGLWNNYKRCNISIMILSEQEREKGRK